MSTINVSAPIMSANSIGQFRQPQLHFAWACHLDSLANPAENLSDGAIITITATATGTTNSPDQTNTVQRGANIFLNITALGATCTVGLNIQEKDPASGNYITIYRTSLDAQTANTLTQVQIYPGVVSTGQANLFLVNAHLGLTWRAQVSITATASGGGTSVAYTVGATPLL